MPPPRFQHGYAHDVFLSYTHVDDQVDAGQQWVTKFVNDLRARIEIVSGHTIDIWRDEDKLGAADRFNDTIAAAIRNSAVLLVVLSPSYFNSEYCQKERMEFYSSIHRVGKESVNGKARVMKVAKFRVPLDKYPADLRDLLEHRFYVELPGSSAVKEFRFSEDPAVRDKYFTKLDDVAQETAGLLAAMEPVTVLPEPKDVIYLAETTSDIDGHRCDLRRHLLQLGYDVEPKSELRLLPAREISQFVTESIRKCRLAIHPVGAYYGVVPEGADGKSLVQIQLELSEKDSRNGDLGRIIWLPEGIVPQEDTQKQFLQRLRTEFAGRHFELLERPFRALTTRIEDCLKQNSRNTAGTSGTPSGIYVVCDNADRALAKNVKFFLFSQGHQVEVTPVSLGQSDLAGNTEHEKLLHRNSAHLVLHGATTDAWIQDRIRELDNLRTSQPGLLQAIFLADPHREDKDEILVRDIGLLEGFSPATVADVLKPLIDRAGRPHGFSAAASGGLP